MKIGRILDRGITKTVLFTEKGLFSISSILGIRDEEVDPQFYDIVNNRVPEVLEIAAKSEPDIAPGWKYQVPIPNVGQIRDFYAFEEHVKAGRKNRGLEMIPEWYEIPVFYYSGTSSLYASGEDIPYPSYSEALDFELEVAVVIGKAGRDISIKDAFKHICGAVFVNDWSARDEQILEMKVNLGPAKGKDFATSVGPYMVTVDELTTLKEDGRLHFDVKGYVNGRLYSEANLGTMYHSFGSMIERASRDVMLHEGDIIMSGTVGTGCILELGYDKYGWLKPGDTVSFESEVLGKLINKVV